MVLRRMMGPSLETGAVLDAVLSVNYCAIAIACLRLPSHLFVMKKGPASILTPRRSGRSAFTIST